MHSLSEHDLLVTLAALALILLVGRAFGEIARRLGQPEVLGQLLAGFVLGPSVLGAVLPSVQHTLLLNPTVGPVLSGFSWVGAILLLLLAGMEVDLAILRAESRPGMLAAGFAIIPSLIAGALFAWKVLGRTPPNGIFLGIVMSVTAVSVASAILIERGSTRRRFAQVILAAGVASEVMVWLFVSIVSSLHSSSPVLQGIKSAAFAVLFFAFMVTIGQRGTFWAMRKVKDVTWIVNGQFSLVVALTFVAAAITHALGLHALLGAFVFGVVLSRAPRFTEALAERIQTLTIGMFGPIFFVLAGTRVDIFQLRTPQLVGAVLLLLVVATAVKVLPAALGARLGGQTNWEAALVGVGLNLKGGTDVVVAIVGTELGLLSTRAYSMYTVVAILTVLFSPPLLQALERKAPPSEEERVRLQSEEAERRAYIPRIERVLVPMHPRLQPQFAVSVVEHLAASKDERGQIFDITRLDVRDEEGRRETEVARERLEGASQLTTVQVTRQQMGADGALSTIINASRDYDLVAIGALPPEPHKVLSLGRLQDSIIHSTESDVLVAVDYERAQFDCGAVRRILVPVNGLEYSLAAGDIAGSLASSCGAEVVLFTSVHSDIGDLTGRDRDERRLAESANSVLDELTFRVERLGVPIDRKVVLGPNAGDEIVKELTVSSYDLVVMGAMDRGTDGRPYLGRSIRTVLMRSNTPLVLLIAHESIPRGTPSSA